ncbi:SapC family protein [Aurantiacibacter spongiae]|uniref:SapC family protein n=1 Tax=Aurantiacibacter spongiae TaxID=2488860 RepID=UPI00131510B3|nr:SapC family protein [Aurantiacibacter spongiae]
MSAELLNNVDHHDLRLHMRWGRGGGDMLSQVLVFPNEFQSVQRHYPIVFRESADGPLRPVALLGLAAGQNLFVTEDGGWAEGHYIPAVLQRGPLAIAQGESPSDDPVILVDPAHSQASSERGDPLFLAQGGNAPALERALEALRVIYVGNDLFDPMIEAFHAAGLLNRVNLEARVSEDATYAVPDVQIIDAKRLASLSDSDLGALNRAGFLQSAFMAAASLGTMQRLADLAAGVSA